MAAAIAGRENEDSMNTTPRRNFMRGALAAAGISAAASSDAQAQTGSAGAPLLPAYARAQHYRSLKQSSYDRTGGNRDSWTFRPAACRRFSAPTAPGISHIWFTIAAQQRASSEGTGAARLLGRQPQAQRRNAHRRFLRPEPGPPTIYQSEYLACSPGKSLNCYFAMPYRKSARGSPSPTKASRRWARSIPTSIT
jgi:hypothetical protein